MFSNEFLMSKGVSLSTEMISPQIDDPVVDTLNNLYDSLITVITQGNLSSRSVMKVSDSREIIREIDRTITKRFGIVMHTVFSSSIPFGILTSAPNSFNILKSNNMEMYEEVVKLKLNKEQHSKYNEQLYSYDDQHKEILYKWKKTVDNIDKAIEKGNLYIDLKNARIEGLTTDPNKLTVYLVANYRDLIVKYNLNAKELTAALLHEVGHQFTHIEYAYRSVKATAITIDTLLDTVDKKNKSPLEGFKLAYKRISMGKDDIDKVDNLPTAYIKFMDKYVKSTIYFSENNKYANTNSESLADNFAVFFGVGGDLSTALEKLEDVKTLSDIGTLGESTSLINTLVNILINVIIITIILPPALLMIISIAAIVYFVVRIIIAIYTKGGLASESRYDDTFRRFERIKTNMIRTVRLTNNKDYIKKMIAEIDYINLTLNNMPKNANVGILDTIVRTLSPEARRLAETKEIDSIIENLIDNELHIKKEKFKNILNKGK